MLKLIILLVLLYLTYQVVREALGLKQRRRGYFQRVYRDLEQQKSNRWGRKPTSTAPRRPSNEVEDASWEDVT